MRNRFRIPHTKRSEPAANVARGWIIDDRAFSPPKPDADRPRGVPPSGGHDFSKLSIYAPGAPASGPVSTAMSDVQHLPFLATIAYRDRDEPAGEGQEKPIDTNAIIARGVSTAAAAAVPDIDVGESVHLPDMLMPEEFVEAEGDSIGGTLTYNPTVTQAGTVNPFGATKWSKFNLTGITVTRASGAFTVKATLDNPITFNVASGGRTNIASANDPALKADNYATAVSDLTPDMSDLKGRPPRTTFWAQDLTVIHEQFHVGERKKFAKEGLATAQTWLNTQSAASAAEVNTLLGQVPGKVVAASQAAMTFPEKEERAYTAGAPAYQARADAIKAKGDASGYP